MMMTTSTFDPIETMKSKILKDAEEQAQKIISEARKEAQMTIEQVKNEMEKSEETEKREIKERIEERKRTRMAEEKTEHLRRLQSYKTEIIDIVFDKALQRLKEYSETKQYKKSLKKLIIEAGISIGGGELIISVNDRDRKIISKKFLEQTAEKIEEKTNTETNLQLAKESLNSLGGAIISKAKESATVVNTLEERLNRKRKQISGELENILFR
jgi:V/A-type H+-transporting ATPase subunit E